MMVCGRDATGILWSILWFFILIFVGFWISGFCAFWYILFNVFSACCPACFPVCEFLLQGVRFTGTCGQAIMEGTPVMEAFK